MNWVGGAMPRKSEKGLRVRSRVGAKHKEGKGGQQNIILQNAQCY